MLLKVWCSGKGKTYQYGNGPQIKVSYTQLTPLQKGSLAQKGYTVSESGNTVYG